MSGGSCATNLGVELEELEVAKNIQVAANNNIYYKIIFVKLYLSTFIFVYSIENLFTVSRYYLGWVPVPFIFFIIQHVRPYT